MTTALTGMLTELDSLLAPHLMAQQQLRPPAAPEEVQAAAGRFGILPTATMEALYTWHNGAAPDKSGVWPVYLFPEFWQFMPLDWLEAQAEWPLTWARQSNIDGFPFAKEETGQFLLAESGDVDRVWQVSSDYAMPAWPDGTMLGLVRATCEALSGQHAEFAAEFADTKMTWVFPSGGSIPNPAI